MDQINQTPFQENVMKNKSRIVASALGLIIGIVLARKFIPMDETCWPDILFLVFIALHVLVFGIIMPETQTPMSLGIASVLISPHLPERIGFAVCMSGLVVFALGILYGMFRSIGRIIKKL